MRLACRRLARAAISTSIAPCASIISTAADLAGKRSARRASSSEGAWPGSRTQLIDGTNLGKYRFEVIDRASNRVLYSRGFASIYGEWETTPEFRTTASHVSRVGAVSLAGRAGSRLHQKRDRQNVFEPLWQVDVDPHSACRVQEPAFDGPVHAPVDVVRERPAEPQGRSAADQRGYTLAQASKFRADATRLVNALFAHEPFKSRRDGFQCQDAATGSAGRTLSVEFNIFGLERYALTYDNRALRNVAAAAPYDVVEVLVNDKRYGGGGIFNQQSTVAAGNESAEYVFIHELAHNLAGLGDEYVGSVTYETGAPLKGRAVGAEHHGAPRSVGARSGAISSSRGRRSRRRCRMRARSARSKALDMSRAVSTVRRPPASWDPGSSTNSAASASARLIASSICTPTEHTSLPCLTAEALRRRVLLKRISLRLCVFASRHRHFRGPLLATLPGTP